MVDPSKGSVRRRHECRACGLRFTVAQQTEAEPNPPLSAAQAGKIKKRARPVSTARPSTCFTSYTARPPERELIDDLKRNVLNVDVF